MAVIPGVGGMIAYRKPLSISYLGKLTSTDNSTDANLVMGSINVGPADPTAIIVVGVVWGRASGTSGSLISYVGNVQMTTITNTPSEGTIESYIGAKTIGTLSGSQNITLNFDSSFHKDQTVRLWKITGATSTTPVFFDSSEASGTSVTMTVNATSSQVAVCAVGFTSDSQTLSIAAPWTQDDNEHLGGVGFGDAHSGWHLSTGFGTTTVVATSSGSTTWAGSAAVWR